MTRATTLCALLVCLMPAMAGAAPPLASQADAIVQKALETGPYPGISVAIEQGGKIIYQRGFGFADVERQIKVEPETRFPVGSITKTFTCLSVLQLTASGSVGLDKAAGDYLPTLAAPARDVTVRQLLNHTSGIANYTDLPDFPMARPVGMSRDDVVGHFATKPLLFKPGTMFNYSNSDTYLLGLIVEKVSGRSYADYVREQVLTPFGMKRSGFDARDNGAKDRARGYENATGGFKPTQLYDFEVPFSAGALVSTPGDLLRYRQGLFGSKTAGKVRDLALTTGPLADGTPNPYALGCLVDGKMEGHRKITHAGNIFGFAADFAYYPDDDLTIAIATNGQNTAFPPISIERKLARLYLGLPPLTAVDAPVPTETGTALAGDYQVGAFRMGFEKLGFVFQDGVLKASFGGINSGAPLLPLRHQGNGRFLSSIDDEVAIDFKQRSDGGVEMVLYFYEGAIRAVKAAAR
ncbi:serine hydrolase domain-containing protein [Niveispirillum sp. KHB5.9]|uniref:serine hydrolase domain-containing protein n=1 Tax=Niveispirillum sp. KHB5.9 TaxID=3400269 RepID=UPI003A8C2E01